MLHVDPDNAAATSGASLMDRARGLLQDPHVVTWRCAGCGWELWCGYSTRSDAQTCDHCGHGQHVPPRAFAWNTRMIRRLDEATARRRADRERAAAAARTLKDRQRAAEAERRAVMRLAAASIAVSSGLVGSAAEFEAASDAEAGRLLELASLARALASDLRAAEAEATAANGGERVVREGAGWGSMACLVFGSFWMAAGLTAASLASREIARDWKRSRAAQYRRRWEETMTSMNDREAKAFARIFSHLHPREAAAINGSLAA
ncbi:MAG: hypothetical protein WCK33_07735 [Phycisphaerae bacterium]